MKSILNQNDEELCVDLYLSIEFVSFAIVDWPKVVKVQKWTNLTPREIPKPHNYVCHPML